MSAARSGNADPGSKSDGGADTASAADRELDALADELYARRPDEFAAARDEQVKDARARGQQVLARELGKLRRPTQSAWLINLLWRDQRDVLEQLFQVAQGLSQAQAQASGPELHRLTAQRRELESALVRRSRALAEEAGVSVSPAMEREAQETLSAALARPEVMDEIRTGRLVKPAAYAGFGTLPAAGAAAGGGARQESPPARGDENAPTPLRPPKIDEVAARAAQRAREKREQAEAQVREAGAARDAAAATLAEDQRNAQAADEHSRGVRAQLETLQQQVHTLQREAVDADKAARTAAQRRDQAEKAQASAQRTLEAAERELAALPPST
ncbi:MAG TPA: hypothetical protein VGQ62_01700 [Chloroflexota bacterium]|nr:hypothetical protein [Chloroflexota bacterium]